MKKIFNVIFYYLQLILFVGAFCLTFFIMLQMNRRLEKSFFTTIDVFVPFIILFILLIINILANQKTVKKNLFYNITSFLIFGTISIVALRAIFDHYLIMGTLNSYQIDFNYFANFIPFLKIMIYGLSLANFLFMFHLKEKKKQ